MPVLAVMALMYVMAEMAAMVILTLMVIMAGMYLFKSIITGLRKMVELSAYPFVTGFT